MRVAVHGPQVNPLTGADVVGAHAVGLLCRSNPEWGDMGFAGGQEIEERRFVYRRTGVTEPAANPLGFHFRIDAHQLAGCIHANSPLMCAILYRQRNHVAGTPVMRDKCFPVNIRQDVPIDEEAGTLPEEFMCIGDCPSRPEQGLLMVEHWPWQVGGQAFSPAAKELRHMMQVHGERPHAQRCRHRVQQALNHRDAGNRQQGLWECMRQWLQAGPHPGGSNKQVRRVVLLHW